MQQNRFIGSLLIIAGTTIGAGMLALPLAASALGFPLAIATMLIIWALMSYTALLMLELHQDAPQDATLHTLARHYLGRPGQWVATASMLFLFYALCAAYIAGGGEQLTSRLTPLLMLPDWSGALIWTAVVAALIISGTGKVDLVNRGLFTLKLIALAVILVLLMPKIEWIRLQATPAQTAGMMTSMLAALPVIFTSFGFHGSIPSVVRYLGVDIKKLRWAILLGSALPLIVYCLWLMVSIGNLGQSALMQQAGLSELVTGLSAAVNSPALQSVIGGFADLALATSFLGVALGLFDFLGDMLRQKRLVTGLITFAPPLAFALCYPSGFIMALGYAAIALVILAIFLPVAMVWQKRHQAASEANYRTRGGTVGLLLAMLSGCAIIGAQLLA
ncbi:tyrosine transporter TyrP [Shewanella submarina]|uniref:Aromatic amino acid transport family protein n=1 Tax=Shewanella submarina TaxID=2016376 RepID=A0ABV7GIP0_9GAMM|nr:aromatic amino acid transport family protein [Shewanella submarina]MCL1039081.1 tyrosine transporter TyrP [Shewanella submarina]